jgi:hypothetical protein
MSFYKKLKNILDKEKPKMDRRRCDNFWCKAYYDVLEDNLIENPEIYKQCPKCRSFSSELSGGVENNGQIEFEGSRYDPNPQEVMYKQYMGNEVIGNKNLFRK